MESSLVVKWNLVVRLFETISGLLYHNFPGKLQLPVLNEHESISKYLDHLSVLVLDAKYSSIILYCFRPLFFEIIARIVSDREIESTFLQKHDVDASNKSIFSLFALSKTISIFNNELSTSTIALIERFLSQRSFLNLQDIEFSQAELNLILVSFYRLLSHAGLFKAFISLKVLHLIINSPESTISNKVLAIEILSKILNFSLIKKSQLLSEYVGTTEPRGTFEAMDDFNYSFLAVYEAKRISNFLSLPQIFDDKITPSENDIHLYQKDLSPSIRLIYGVLIPGLASEKAVQPLTSEAEGFVPIESSVNTLADLTTKVLTGNPILLYGPNGSGKSLIVNHLHRFVRQNDSDLVTLHLNDQTDIKLLLGTYVSSHEPGKFVWKDGVLTTAVKSGKWLVIEDIDKAKNEILSIFTSLIESKELAVNGSEKVSVKNGFQIIATISTSDDEEIKFSKTNIKGDNLEDMDQFNYWKEILFENYQQENLDKGKGSVLPDLISLNKFNLVHHAMPPPSELLAILSGKYPEVSKSLPSNLLWKRIISLFYYMKFRIFARKSLIAMNNGVTLKKMSNFELIRLASHIDLLFQNNKNISESYDDLVDKIFFEAIDIFTCSLQNDNIKRYVISKIGLFLEIPTSQINFHVNIDNNNFNPELKVYDDEIIIGRNKLIIDQINKSFFESQTKQANVLDNFALTQHSLQLLERVSISVNLFEPVLLSGETGCGKTTVVQNLAKLINKKLIVLNLSQETESNDLIGGYKPVLNHQKSLIIPIHNRFLGLFGDTFNLLKNEKFLKIMNKEFKKESYGNVIKLWKKAVSMAEDYINKQKEKLSISENSEEEDGQTSKKKRKLNSKLELLADWKKFEQEIFEFQVQYEKASTASNSLQFDFIEGSLVKAVKNGDWILLDEINLASAETLENISDLLSNDPAQRKLLLTEKASDKSQNEVAVAHKEFRLFGCMNPSTDVGKKNLPENIRSRFNEIFVDSPDKNRSDLKAIVNKYLWSHLSDDDYTNEQIIEDIVSLYYKIKELNDRNLLVDGSKNKIVVNIRILSRALMFTTDIIRTYGIRRSLYEAFNMILLTLLDSNSEKLLLPIIFSHTIGKAPNVDAIIKRKPPCPSHLPVDKAVQFAHYWLEKGEFDIVEQPQYIITPFVRKNLLNLVRATLTKRFPILIQGPTSSGKTSMITYLAKITGNKVIRINNHEHTDLQEYLGSYVSDPKTGKLVFKHGPLIEALKKGYWIILDELNLASSEILEGINRLLDDNREIFLTETQELIKPHKNFLLFATQNPPGAVYGGRKFLSKAFKNRFLELNFDDIPQDELEVILCNRCQIPPSYAKKVVLVYKELGVQRSSNRIFENKNSFATLRDLFRWGSREAVGYEQLAINGYMLLAEKNRKSEEKEVIKSVIEKVMRVKLDAAHFYKAKFDGLSDKLISSAGASRNVVWTKEMQKLAILIIEALNNKENILLVGETGCGKTTVCSTLAQHYYQQNMIFLNAHQNIETSDIIGSQRPVRGRSKLQELLKLEITKQLTELNIKWSSDYDLNDFAELYESNKSIFSLESVETIEGLFTKLKILFEWSDGPLINAMKQGDIFLFDEISLAEDSVLERLNSVLEPEKTLYLTEYSNDIDSNLIVAQPSFSFLATMNPGGDYGKKELSPALRNRFTEIYVPSMSDFSDVALIVQSKLESPVKYLTEVIVKFAEWFSVKFSANNSSFNNGVISIRDILAWVDFINRVYTAVGNDAALLHGVCIVFVDALGTNNTAYLASDVSRLNQIKSLCIEKLSVLAKANLSEIYAQEAKVSSTESALSIGLFNVPKKPAKVIEGKLSFNLRAPTTAVNAMRVLRAMVIKKPILLEGDPGVGKSSLIDALAKATNNKLTRINLSDQTDLVDLFGSDSPVEGGNFGEFVWKDAPFLRAMKCGEWVLLDEMNLASPSLLEALNSVFDFRQRVYIPELDQEFECHSNFRVFAAQNPQYQGGGRKGLPKSFINRFSNVYIGKLNSVDVEMICKHIYPNIPSETISKLVKFVFELENNINIKKQWGFMGGPWEFNIRDIIKFLDISRPNALDLVFAQKFRLQSDRDNIYSLYEKIFGSLPPHNTYFYDSEEYVQANNSALKKFESTAFAIENSLLPLQSNISALESIFTSVEKRFPVLLVGPTLGGKSDLVNFAANLVGARLETVHIHNEIDITDLVGGLDQYHLNKELLPFLQELEIFLVENSLNQNETEKAHSIFAFLDYLRAFKGSLSIALSNGDENELKLNTLEENLVSLQDSLNNETLSAFIIQLEAVRMKKGRQFQFFDGILIDALEKGYWLHLSNINLVSSSIVDRLNSLTETNGVLVVSESSSTNGAPKVIKPHPNFRLFLSMNPKYGELSRAMRNRCAEIYIDSFENRATEFDKLCLGLSETVSLLDSSDSNKIEESFSKLNVSENANFKESFSSHFAKSKDPVARSLLAIFDILSHSFNNADIRFKVPYVVACFVPTFLREKVFDFFEFCQQADNFSANEKLALRSLVNFLKFLQSSGLFDALAASANSQILPQDQVSLISLIADSSSFTFTFSFAKSLFNFFEFSQKLKLIVEAQGDTESVDFELVNDVFDFVKSALFTENVLEDLCELLSSLSIHGMLALDTKEPEKFNFIIEQIKDLTESLCKSNANLALPGSNLSSFSVSNSRSMTLLWNHFVLLPDAIDRLVKILPDAWKPFISVDLHNDKIVGVSLDLQKFKNHNNIINDFKGSFFEQQFRDLLGLIEIMNTAKGEFHINENFLLLAMRSGKSAVSLSERYVGKLIKPYPFALDYNYDSNKSGSIPFIKKAVENSYSLSEIPGNDIRSAVRAVKFLSSEVIVNSNVLINDQLSYFTTILSNWLKEILLSQLVGHEEIVETFYNSLDGEDSLEHVINNLVDDIRSIPGYSNLASVIVTYFIPSFIIIYSAAKDFPQLGKAYIFFCTGLIQLFVPGAPYDPAICEFVLYDLFTIRKGTSSAYKNALQIVRKLLSGDREIFFESSIGEIEESVKEPRVERPSEGSIKNLFDEWTSFMESSVGSSAIEKLLSSLESDSGATKVSMLHKSTRRFLLNLSENFTDYQDLNSILKGGIIGLNFGFALTQMSAVKSNRSDALSSLLYFDQFLKSNKDQCTILKSFAFFRNTGVSNDEHLDSLSMVLVDNFKKWKAEITKKEKEQEISENLFKYHGLDEEETEDAYKSLFPDFDDEENREADSSITPAYDFTDKPTVGTTFIDTFLSASEDSMVSVVDAANDNKISWPSGSGTATPAMVTSLLHRLYKAVGVYESQCLESSDFYFKPNFYQFSQCLSIIDDIKDNISSLLDQWPDNATLININNACDEIRNFASAAPLAKLIVKVEQILKFLNELILYSHGLEKKVINSFVERLTSLIIRWRQLELGSFNNLMHYEHRMLDQKLDQSYYLLFELLIVGFTNGEKQAEEVVSLLNLYLSNSSQGEFSNKLKLLKAFVIYLKDAFSRDVSLVSNVISFYEQFSSIIEGNLEKVRTKLTKEINEVILLASWKDTNIDALRESSKKSKRALYKVIKKYRAALSLNVKQLVENGLEYKLSTADCALVSSPRELQIVKYYYLNNEAWQKQPKILSNLAAFIPKVTELRERLQTEELPELYDFCKLILSEMDRLRKATPKELTDDNKKAVSALKTEKRVLLSTVIKDLKAMGLKTQETQKYKLTATSILANAQELSSFENFDDNIFFRILDLLPKLRNSVANCAEDIPREDAFKGLAIAEHLIFSLYSLRAPLNSLLGYESKFNKDLKSFEKIAACANGTNVIVKPSRKIEATEKVFKEVTAVLPKLLDFGVETIERSVTLGNLRQSNSDIFELFNNTKADISSFNASYLSLSSELLTTNAKVSLFEQFVSFVTSFRNSLVNLSSKHKELTFVFKLVQDWLSDVSEISLVNDEEKPQESHDFESILDKIIELGKSAAVALQSIKQDSSTEITVDTEKYFLKVQQRYVTYNNHLYVEQIHSKMVDVIKSIANSSFETTIASVVKYFLPLFNEYYNFVVLVSQAFANNYLSVTKSTYVLSTALYKLATDGFCSPQGLSEEDDKTESGPGGGGLGDDMAADSKTNDNIEEEDLDEDALTANKDDKDERDDDKDGDDEEDKALDIEGDMEGQNEDMEPQDDDETAEKGDNEAEDLDEEIDDLDELDPNAVDDKMWDEGTQDDKKEKDSDQLPENSKPDSNDLEAMDDDTNAGDNKDNEAANEEKEGEENDENNKVENDENADDEEDVGQQDDEVVQDDNEQLDSNVPDTEALELPEDLNLDKEEEGDKEEDKGDEDFENDDEMNIDDNLDEPLNLEQNEEAEKKEESEEAQQEAEDDFMEEDQNMEEEEENVEENGEAENEENEKEKVGDEEPDLQSDEKEKDKTEQNEDQGNDEVNKDNIEGADANVEDNAEDIDTEASAKQQTGEEREGADEANGNANTAGASGSFHDQPENQQNEEQSKQEQKESLDNEKLKESLRQLGNSLDEFYKRSEEILDSNEVTQEEQENKNAENPDQFQHLDDEKEQDCQQALGNADQDQVQTIDEDKQIQEETNKEEADAEDEENSTDPNVMEEIPGDNESIDGDKHVAIDEDLDVNNEKETEGCGNSDEDNKDEKIKTEEDEDENNRMDVDKDEEGESDLDNNEVVDENDDFTSVNIIDLENHPDLEPALSYEDASKLWQESEFATNELSLLLCEQLRLILSPTIATKLKGDYKTGKRLNLKKIISYIASDFKKDKIWLKRTKPSKRNYQIMLSIDDSKSMSENPETVKLTYHTISLVSKALTQLESGDLSIVKFGQDTSIIHNFNKKFDTKSDGPKSFQWFSFNDTVTNMKDLIQNSIEIFNRNAAAASNSDLYKLEIIVSDGICENHEEISRLVRKAKEEKLLIVFVIIDGLNKSKESIADMSQVKYNMDPNGNMNMQIDKYLDTFPFENYVIVENINELPEMICQILRTFFMNSV